MVAYNRMALPEVDPGSRSSLAGAASPPRFSRRSQNSRGEVGPSRPEATYTAATQANSTYLSDLDWVTAVNGFQSIGIDKANGGVKDIYLGGIRYAKGPGVHANSEITYAIGAGYKRFVAKVGASEVAIYRPRMALRLPSRHVPARGGSPRSRRLA
jgi:hypothetical protein